MDRKEIIKKLREVIRVLKDSSIFLDGDFLCTFEDDKLIPPRVKTFIKSKLDL